MRTIDVHPIIDNARFTPFHWMVMAWCGLLLIFDGYDLFIYGVVLPVIMKEWGLTPLQAGALGSYALFGMMFGALAFGSLADRIGRKKGIAICFALFSGATILNGFASSPSEFGIYRFIAGLGCGGLMPNAVALMNEYAPKRLRSTLVAIMFSGYSLGGMLSAGVGIFMLPRFGWESMFFAAAVPLLLLPVILYYLPESIGFLVRQGVPTRPASCSSGWTRIATCRRMMCCRQPTAKAAGLRCWNCFATAWPFAPWRCGWRSSAAC